MTANQIAYWRNQEDARHNYASEQETKRHNLDTEDMNRNLAVFQSYNQKYQGDAAKAKQFESVAKGVGEIFKPLTGLFSMK